MKKHLAFAVLILMVPASAMAGADGNCGVGSKVWDGQKGVAPQVMAMTTNGTFYQTFAVTSGTSGCSQDGVVRSNWKTSMFIDGNKEKLARDMSIGQGETLDSLAKLLGVRDEHRASFFLTTKEHFGQIFPSGSVSTEQIMASLKQVLAGEEELANYSAAI